MQSDDLCPQCGADADERPDNSDEGQPDFRLGNDGRSSGTPTPPGAEILHDGAQTTAGLEPVTTYRSKQVMIDAERTDEITVDLVVNGETNVPKTYTVSRRNPTYYGPSLELHTEIDGEGHNYRLTCPGPNTQLILWRKIGGGADSYVGGYVPVSEVTAHILGVEQYSVCDHCERPVKTLWHERLSAVGTCEGLDDPELSGGDGLALPGGKSDGE